MDYINQIVCGDCLEVMPQLPDKVFDMILCDLPYGTTACKWDTIIPFEPLWEQYKRIVKDNAVIVLTASQPFTSMLVMSNLEMFRYCMVWEKDRPSDFGNANIKPMRYHEDICVFYKHTPKFTKSYKKRTGSGADRMKYPVKIGVRLGHQNEHRYGTKPQIKKYREDGLKIIGSVISIPIERRMTGQHPTQKPVALFEYLIRTYTNEGDLVLDNCIGSGTTAIAADRLNRRFFGIDIDPHWVEVSLNRLAEDRLKRSQLEMAL